MLYEQADLNFCAEGFLAGRHLPDVAWKNRLLGLGNDQWPHVVACVFVVCHVRPVTHWELHTSDTIQCSEHKSYRRQHSEASPGNANLHTVHLTWKRCHSCGQTHVWTSQFMASATGDVGE